MVGRKVGDAALPHCYSLLLFSLLLTPYSTSLRRGASHSISHRPRCTTYVHSRAPEPPIHRCAPSGRRLPGRSSSPRPVATLFAWRLARATRDFRCFRMALLLRRAPPRYHAHGRSSQPHRARPAAVPSSRTHTCPPGGRSVMTQRSRGSSTMAGRAGSGWLWRPASRPWGGPRASASATRAGCTRGRPRSETTGPTPRPGRASSSRCGGCGPSCRPRSPWSRSR